MFHLVSFFFINFLNSLARILIIISQYIYLDMKKISGLHFQMHLTVDFGRSLTPFNYMSLNYIHVRTPFFFFQTICQLSLSRCHSWWYEERIKIALSWNDRRLPSWVHQNYWNTLIINTETQKQRTVLLFSTGSSVFTTPSTESILFQHKNALFFC